VKLLTLRSTFLWASGLIGLIVPSLFAVEIYTDNLSANLATWVMVLILDGLGLLLVIKAGNKKPFMQIGWATAATLIVLSIIVSDSSWDWGWVETSSVICCTIAIWLWQTKSAQLGLWPYMLALFISFGPQVDDVTQPQPETWWLWTWTIVGCVCAINYRCPKERLRQHFCTLGNNSTQLFNSNFDSKMIIYRIKSLDGMPGMPFFLFLNQTRLTKSSILT